MIEKVERLITEINRIHREYSKDYFETGKVEKINLKHTFSKVPTKAILAYRLNLHESINDYLMKADVQDIAYVYRVKTSESILDKITRFSERQEGYPVNSILNDIFGARMILSSKEIAQVMEKLDDCRWSNRDCRFNSINFRFICSPSSIYPFGSNGLCVFLYARCR